MYHLGAVTWVAAIVSAIFWVSVYLIFFQKQIKRWWKARPHKAAARQAEAVKAAEAHARYVEELASKYPLPGASSPPQPR